MVQRPTRWQTRLLSPDAAGIAAAAAILRAGGLVAFPTETVYGLGAHALDAVAVARIFAAKERPANNPLIVHVADARQGHELVRCWPETAAKLAARFWPGPLTLVLPRSAAVPDLVTGGVPIAAPSANRSTQLSPTRAVHVLRGLEGRIDMILDGGPTAGGLESTVLD